MPRAQCIIVRHDRILMARHRMDGVEYWCLPGGAVEPGESPLQAALRELLEECCVRGRIIRPTSVWDDGMPGGISYSFHIDIGDQEPVLGEDPEPGARILRGIRWMALHEIPERDRAFLWAAGLLGVAGFFGAVEKWGDELSYPGLR